MKKQQKLFRFSEEELKQLEFIKKLHQERINIQSEKMNIEPYDLSDVGVIRMLLSQEYKNLKSQGYEI